jgi:hypothetical protein
MQFVGSAFSEGGFQLIAQRRSLPLLWFGRSRFIVFNTQSIQTATLTARSLSLVKFLAAGESGIVLNNLSSALLNSIPTGYVPISSDWCSREYRRWGLNTIGIVGKSNRMVLLSGTLPSVYRSDTTSTLVTYLYHLWAALDTDGNSYLSFAASDTIYKTSPTGFISTIYDSSRVLFFRHKVCYRPFTQFFKLTLESTFYKELYWDNHSKCLIRKLVYAVHDTIPNSRLCPNENTQVCGVAPTECDNDRLHRWYHKPEAYLILDEQGRFLGNIQLPFSSRIVGSEPGIWWVMRTDEPNPELLRIYKIDIGTVNK